MARVTRDDTIRDFAVEQDTADAVDVEPETVIPDEVREPFQTAAREIVMIKSQVKTLTARESVVKKALMEVLEHYGARDLKGHRYIELDPHIRGTARAVRQRRVSQGVDKHQAEAITRLRGVYDVVFKEVTTMVLDEDALYTALAQGKLTDQDLAAIFPETVTYAFTLEKE